MSTATDLLSTAENPATKKVHEYLESNGEKPDPSEWLQMLSQTHGIVLRVSQYYLSYDGSAQVTVISKDIRDEHSHESRYIESLLEYYNPEPVYVTEAPSWVSTDK